MLARRGALRGGIALTTVSLPALPVPAGTYRLTVRIVPQVNPGTILLQLLLALHGGLDTEHTIAVLPHLRLAADGERPHLSEADARRVVHGSGIVGGTPGNPGRAREWAPRLADREAQLRELLAWLEPDEAGEDEPGKARHALGRRDAEGRWRGMN